MVKMMPKLVAMKYFPLLVFQLILLGLFFALVRYDATPPEAKGFEDTHVMIFIGFGFLMTFLKKYCYSALGINWLLGAIVIQWALICQCSFHMENGVIPLSKFSIVEADIMAATILITFGAVLGVASGPQLIVIAIVETVVACSNLYLVGSVLKAADIGGSIAIHSFGAFFGLGVSLAFRKKPRSSPEGEGGENLNGPTYVSDVTAMIGSIFLWIYWPSFNSALAESRDEYERAVLNTYLSLAACTVTSFVLSAAVSHEGKFDMVHIQNSTLAGGVAVGSVCNMHIQPGGAIAVGMGAAVISVCGYRWLTPKLASFGLLDTCGVNNLHGMPGVYSGLLSILFAALATRDTYGPGTDHIFPAMENDARTAGTQALYQLIAVAATVAIAFVSGIVTGFLSKLPIFTPLEDSQKYNDEVNWEIPPA